MNYVKFYKKQTNHEYDSKKFSVHHIDGNRENNSIDNLVMLPQRLHNKYHFLKRSLDDSAVQLATKIVSVSDRGCHYNDYAMDLMKKFVECWGKCCMWADYKNYLLGYMPNIHFMDTENKIWID